MGYTGTSVLSDQFSVNLKLFQNKMFMNEVETANAKALRQGCARWD